MVEGVGLVKPDNEDFLLLMLQVKKEVKAPYDICSEVNKVCLLHMVGFICT